MACTIFLVASCALQFNAILLIIFFPEFFLLEVTSINSCKILENVIYFLTKAHLIFCEPCYPYATQLI